MADLTWAECSYYLDCLSSLRGFGGSSARRMVVQLLLDVEGLDSTLVTLRTSFVLSLHGLYVLRGDDTTGAV